jgi:hypothetical protein
MAALSPAMLMVPSPDPRRTPRLKYPIPPSRFIDGVCDHPLDGWEIGFRHVCLRVPWCQHQPHPFSCRARGLAAFGKRTHLPVMMLDPTEEETDALTRLLSRAIDDDRYPLSPRMQTVKAILAKLRPEPVREPLPPPKVYAPPRATAARRRRG